MKKYISLMLIALIGVLAVSCSDRIVDSGNYQDNDTYSVVLDIKNTSFTNSGGNYVISRTFSKPLYDSDMVLIYRQDGTTTNGAPVWQQIPRTLYLDNGRELDYDFDFSKYDIQIYAGGNYDIATTPQYINNQTFRVVIVPASFGNKNNSVDYSNYNSVIQYYKIDDSKVKSF